MEGRNRFPYENHFRQSAERRATACLRTACLRTARVYRRFTPSARSQAPRSASTPYPEEPFFDGTESTTG